MTVNDITEPGMYWVANANGWSPYEVYEHPQRGGLHVHAMRHPGVFTLDYIKSEFRYREAVLSGAPGYSGPPVDPEKQGYFRVFRVIQARSKTDEAQVTVREMIAKLQTYHPDQYVQVLSRSHLDGVFGQLAIQDVHDSPGRHTVGKEQNIVRIVVDEHNAEISEETKAGLRQVKSSQPQPA